MTPMRTVSLHELGFGEIHTQVTGITHNSGWVEFGFVFVAIQGIHQDGHNFIPDAIKRGAVAVVGSADLADIGVPYLRVENTRQALADMSCIFFGHPSRELYMVGVTGTDGKTTTSWMTHHLLSEAVPTGLLSTVGYMLADGMLRHFPQHFTTPEAPEIQRILRDMKDSGCQAVVLEVSSHALELERVRGIAFDVGIWTNLTPEHLDFHGDMAHYFEAKRKLLDQSKYALVNLDNEWTASLADLKHVQGFGIEAPEATWLAQDILEDATGLRFFVRSMNDGVDLPMLGRFNVYNALAALAAAHHFGMPWSTLREKISHFPGIPGRMQCIWPNPRVIVDFAHTPPSVEHVLKTLRKTTQGRLIIVLGSAGGNRDPRKRAPLGEMAARFADHAIFTEEDHRETPIWEILHEMQRGALRVPNAAYEMIPDRHDAIAKAIAMAQPEDTVVLAGKGPEDTLERNGSSIPWNEVNIALKILKG